MWGRQWPVICGRRGLTRPCTALITHISHIALRVLRSFRNAISDEQFYGDVRTIPLEMMAGYDAIVQLAAISNDPMGNQFEDVTLDINQNATISIAKAAATSRRQEFRVRFKLQCLRDCWTDRPRKETDPLNPITAYAKSKIGAERGTGENRYRHGDYQPSLCDSLRHVGSSPA